MSLSEHIKTKILAAMPDAEVTVIDESEKHRGHAGYREGGESHFKIKIISSAFDGKSRLERHRMINNLLESELETRIHALSLILKTC